MLLVRWLIGGQLNDQGIDSGASGLQTQTQGIALLREGRKLLLQVAVRLLQLLMLGEQRFHARCQIVKGKRSGHAGGVL